LAALTAARHKNFTIMNLEVIGQNAGVVWEALHEKNEQSVKVLKKALKLKDKEILPALGWLAREGKVSFQEVEDETIVSLI
jgi:transcription initiation factor IIE alpha subunit